MGSIIAFAFMSHCANIDMTSLPVTNIDALRGVPSETSFPAHRVELV